MTRRILFSMLIGVAFAITLTASDAKARVFHRVRGPRPACYKLVKQTPHGGRATQTRSAFPKWTWDVPLDVRAWRWPPYYRR
jgi:hypothetical protein